MEYGESSEETAIREVYEETGLRIEISDMIGVYSKYFHTYPNGDRIQMCSVFFRGIVNGGKLNEESEETAQLKYFGFEDFPPIFHLQHEEAIHDYFTECVGVFR